jgi:hypothetical protein
MLGLYIQTETKVAQSVKQPGYGLDDTGFNSWQGQQIFVISKMFQLALGIYAGCQQLLLWQ